MYPLIRVSDSLAIPTYYLVICLTVCAALLWVAKRAVHFNLSQKRALDLGLVLMVTGFIGARLFHVFYEDFPFYQEDWLRILYFWNGGFVFYGGALFAAFCAITILFLKERPKLERYLDLFAPVLSFAYGFGRIGCFLAGCCYGKYCELPWAISSRHPTQLYAFFWELGSIFILIGLERTERKSRPAILCKDGSVFFIWMILHGCGRLIMEAFRDDFRGPSLGLSISSWISIGIILLGVVFLLRPPVFHSRK